MGPEAHDRRLPYATRRERTTANARQSPAASATRAPAIRTQRRRRRPRQPIRTSTAGEPRSGAAASTSPGDHRATDPDLDHARRPRSRPSTTAGQLRRSRLTPGLGSLDLAHWKPQHFCGSHCKSSQTSLAGHWEIHWRIWMQSLEIHWRTGAAKGFLALSAIASARSRLPASPNHQLRPPSLIRQLTPYARHPDKLTTYPGGAAGGTAPVPPLPAISRNPTRTLLVMTDIWAQIGPNGSVGSVICRAPRPALSCALRALSCISTTPLPSCGPSPTTSATGSQTNH
jgi:hypothetical protein